MLNAKVKTLILTGFLLGFSAIFVGPVSAAKFKGKRWAVVIGVQEYKAPIPTLTSPLNDAEAFYNFLKSPQGGSFADDHIRYLKGPEVTRDSIATAMGTFLNKTDRDDYVMVYLSGHGMVEPGHTDRYYFLTSESDAGNLSGTAVRMDDIYRWISEIRAGKKLIIADVCHSGAISASGAMVKGTNSVHEYMEKLGESYDGMGVFTSSRSTQLSQEFGEEDKQNDPEKNKSVFTYYLLQALSSKASEIDQNGKQDGIIDTKEAYEWVRQKVSEHTNSEQIPDFRGDNESGMPLSVVDGSDLSTVSMDSPAGDDSGNAATLAWNAIKDSQRPSDFKEYMNSFGNSPFYFTLAENRYNELIQKQMEEEKQEQLETEKAAATDNAWSAIKDSQNPADFQDFMKAFDEHPFYYSLAKRRYDELVQKQIEDEKQKEVEAEKAAAADSAWSAIKDSQNPADFEDFMKSYSEHSFFYSLAKRRYDELNQKRMEEEKQKQLEAERATEIRTAWSAIKDSQNLADFEIFMRKYRDDKFYYSRAKRRHYELSQQGKETDREKEAAAEWSRIKHRNDRTEISNFFRQYKGTKYYYVAKNEYKQMMGKSNSSSSTPPKGGYNLANPSYKNNCKDRVQGKIAWNYNNNKSWTEANLDRLCGRTVKPKEPPKCFYTVMFRNLFNGTNTKWKWSQAIALCQGTNNSSKTIACFKKNITRNYTLKNAVKACGTG